MKMKTFVVTGVCGEGFDTSEHILYAGQDEQKAMEMSPDTNYQNLYLEVWAKGMMIQSYSKNNIHKWKLEFDKLKDVETEIERKKSEIEKDKQVLNDLISLLEDN
jgi:hypothetical protein